MHMKPSCHLSFIVDFHCYRIADIVTNRELSLQINIECNPNVIIKIATFLEAQVVETNKS